MKILRNLVVVSFFFIVFGLIFSRSSYADTLSSFNSTTPLPNPINLATSVEYNGYVYEIGGYSTSNSSNMSTVYYAPILSSGALGNWSTTTPLPTSIDGATSIVYNGYVYEIGGYDVGNTLSSVYYAPILSSGGLGNWSTTTSLPVGISYATSVEYNGYVYEIAGYNSSSSYTLSSVYYAPILSSGGLGSWSTTSSLPIRISSATSVAYNGYVYEIGIGDNVQGTVYYAPILSSGALGNWSTTTSIPVVINQATAIEYNGYIYEIGGYNINDALTSSTIYSAPILSSGELGSWSTTTSIPVSTLNATSVEYNGYIYEIGGVISNNTALTSNVYYSQILDTTSIYSILGSNGSLYNFGSNNYGDMSNVTKQVPSKVGVSYSQTPNDLGYYILTSDGGVYTFGNAQFYGSLYNIPNIPVKTPVAIATTPDGLGYYILTKDGAVYTFGDAKFEGSLYNIPSTAISDRNAISFGLSPDGNGYYIMTSNGSVYTFGDAKFQGSLYNVPSSEITDRNAVAFGLSQDGNGYYILTSNGSVYTFGDAKFYGSMYNITNPPVRTPVSFELSSDGNGYYILTSNGAVYTFGDAQFLGSVYGKSTPVSME